MRFETVPVRARPSPLAVPTGPADHGSPERLRVPRAKEPFGANSLESSIWKTMRTARNPQRILGQLPIEDIPLDPGSRDDILTVLIGVPDLLASIDIEQLTGLS